MNKQELIGAVALDLGYTNAEAKRAVEAVVDSVSRELAAGGSVALVGFGTFAVKERAARTGRNPQTGVALQIAASKSVNFKAGKALKDSL